MNNMTLDKPDLPEIFTNEDEAVRLFESVRWPLGRFCPRCGSGDTHPRKDERYDYSYYYCRKCRKAFSYRHDTVIENTNLPLKKWLQAIHIITSSKRKVVGAHLAEELGISHIHTCKMLNRLKNVCSTSTSFDRALRNLAKPPRMLAKNKNLKRAYVYIITTPLYPRWYKIGVAKNCKKRLSQYQTSDPFKRFVLYFTYKTPYYREIEKYMHRKFDNKGEWVTGNLNEIIREITNYSPVAGYEDVV